MEKISQIAYVVGDPCRELRFLKAVKFNSEIKILCKQINHSAGGFSQDAEAVVVLAVNVPKESNVSFYIIAPYSKSFDGKTHEVKHTEFIREAATPDCFLEKNVGYETIELKHSNEAFHEHEIRV